MFDILIIFLSSRTQALRVILTDEDPRSAN